MKRMLLLTIGCLVVSTVAFSQASKNVPVNPKSPDGLSDQTVPNVISYQGVLTTSSGAPATDGIYSLKFELYNDTTAGFMSWTETQSSVSVQRGTFHVALGSVTAFPSYEFNSPLFIQVTAMSGPGIGAPVAFSPRTPLMSSAYSLALKLPYVAGVTNSSPGLQVWNNGTGAGIWGGNFGGSATSSGVYGYTLNGIGVYGEHGLSSGTAPGVEGKTQSTASNANAIYGEVSNSSPGSSSAAVRGANNGTGGSGIGVYGSQNGSGWGVYGYTPSGIGVLGSTSSGYGVEGSSSTGIGVYGASSNGTGIYGTTSTNQNTINQYAVYGLKNNSLGLGVFSGTAILGESDSSYGVSGLSVESGGVLGFTYNGYGVFAQSFGTGYALYSAGPLAVVGSGDASVQLPNGSVNSQEILDEPGVAAKYYTAGGGFFILSNSAGVNQTVDSVSITTPGAGKIILQSSGYVNVSHTTGTLDNIGVNIMTNPSNAMFTNGVSSFEIPGANPTTFSERRPFANLLIFDAASAGTYKFYLVINQFSGANIGSSNVAYSSMVATYYPTTYGSTPVAVPGIVSSTHDGTFATASAANKVSYQSADEYKSIKTTDLNQKILKLESQVRKLERLIEQSQQVQKPSQQQ